MIHNVSTESYVLLFLLHVLLSVSRVQGDKAPYCLDYNSKDRPEEGRPKEGTYRKAFGCLSHHIELHCCMEGYTTLLWYFHDAESDVWQPFDEFKNGWNNRYLIENNQTLVYENMTKYLAGNYSCIGTNFKGEQLSDYIWLNAERCAQFEGDPVIHQPGLDENNEVLLGTNVSFNCVAFFGWFQQNCPEDSCSITWARIPFSDGKAGRASQVGSDPSQHVYAEQENYDNSVKSNVLVSTLYIKDIEEADLGVYTCFVFSARLGASQRSMNVSEDVPNTVYAASATHLYIWIAVAAVAVVAVIIAGCLWTWWLELRLLYKDCFSKPPDDNKIHDAFVLHDEHSDVDTTFARENLCEHLHDNHHLDIKSTDDLNGGQGIFAGHLELANMCRCVLIVMSPDLLNSQQCLALFHQIVNEQYRNIIFVTFRDITGEWTDQHEALQAAYNVGRKVRWPLGEDGRRKMCCRSQEREREVQVDTFYKQLRCELPTPQVARRVVELRPEPRDHGGNSQRQSQCSEMVAIGGAAAALPDGDHAAEEASAGASEHERTSFLGADVDSVEVHALPGDERHPSPHTSSLASGDDEESHLLPAITAGGATLTESMCHLVSETGDSTVTVHDVTKAPPPLVLGSSVNSNSETLSPDSGYGNDGFPPTPHLNVPVV